MQPIFPNTKYFVIGSHNFSQVLTVAARIGDACAVFYKLRCAPYASILKMRTDCTLAALVMALCFSCNPHPDRTGSAARSGNTFEHPALQQRLVHERWHGDLDGIAKRR